MRGVAIYIREEYKGSENTKAFSTYTPIVANVSMCPDCRVNQVA
jgi:hypothetical protein